MEMSFGQVWLCQKDGCTCSQFQLLLSKDHEFCMQVVKKTIPNNSQPHLWNRFDSSKKSGRILLKMFKTRRFEDNVLQLKRVCRYVDFALSLWWMFVLRCTAINYCCLAIDLPLNVFFSVLGSSGLALLSTLRKSLVFALMHWWM